MLNGLAGGLTLCALLASLSVAAEYRCDFAPTEAGQWETRQAAGGQATFAAEGLLLDLRAPQAGKEAWVQLRPALRLPVAIEWEQQLAVDSPHCYPTGALLRDLAGHMLSVGMSGQPQEHRLHAGGLRSETGIEPGRWYAFRLDIDSARRGRLVVREAEGTKEVWQATLPDTGLRGAFIWLTLYHNQRPDQGPDQYAQDRGASRFRKLRITAGAIVEGDVSQYRDASLRSYDSHAPTTYNRAMVWLGRDDGVEGTVLAYDRGAELPLTGERQVASWLPNRGCTMRPSGPTTSVFARPNDLDGPDVVALRCLQWCVRQHPILEYELTPRAGACWLKVCLVETCLGDGIEVFRSEATAQPASGRLDLLAALTQHGLAYHQFGEIAVYVYQERPTDRALQAGEAEVKLRLTGSGALVTTPPLVRTEQQARAGFPIYALVTGPDGEPLRGEAAKVEAVVGQRRLPLTQQPGRVAFAARLQGLTPGEHAVRLEATTRAGQRFTQPLSVAVVPGEYAHSRAGRVSYDIGGKPIPTLLGDLYAWAPMLDPESPQRRLILSAEEWSKLSAEEQGRVKLLKHRSLTEAEIRQQLEAHTANGIRVIRLAHNVTPHEACLDGGGHVAMPGLETLLAVLRECRRLNLKVLLNVFHYPYGSPGTGGYAPWQPYVDAGYAGPQSFTDPKVWPLEAGYLSELLACLRDDPAMLGYSLTGENDQAYGAEFVNKLYDHVRTCDPNHLVTLEQGGGIQHCSGGQPWAYADFKPAASGGVGYRTYYTEGMRSDAYFMVCGRFYRCSPPAFLAEVASGPGWYNGFAQTWAHPDFLTKVRDNCWASVLTQETMCLTWSAPWTQHERLVPQQCMAAMDWSRFERARPAVGVLVKPMDRAMVRRLADVEAALAKLGVDYDYVWDGRDDPKQYAVVLDARETFTPPVLPEAVLAQRPLVATGEFSVSYLLDASRRQMVAFVKNTADYRLGPGYGTGVQELHRQREQASPLALTLRGFAATCRYRIYDVEDRRVVREGRCGGETLDLGTTHHDFAVVVY